MQSELSELFTVYPTTALTVEAVPAPEPGNATHYIGGTPDVSDRRELVAYAEGWAVYAEALGKRSASFRTGSDYGRLNTELMRAVRLVVDTGIHANGWNREQAVVYFRESGSADEVVIQGEVDRYIAWPAQALSYKIGQLEIPKASPTGIAGAWLGFRYLSTSRRSSKCWKPAAEHLGGAGGCVARN